MLSKKGVLKSKKEWILICDLDMSVQPSQIDIWYKKNFILKKNGIFCIQKAYIVQYQNFFC